MKRKSLKKRFLGYISLAVAFTAVLNIVSFLVINNMSGNLGSDGEIILRNYIIFIIIFWVAFFIDALFVNKNMKRIEEPVIRVSDTAIRISQGKSIDPPNPKDYENSELGDLVYATNEWLEYMHARCDILDQINAGDYSVHLEPLGDVDLLTCAIIRVLNTNNEVLFEIKKAVQGINEASHGIARGADTLSSGSSEQAATIEEFSAVMAEVQFMSEKTDDVAKKTKVGASESMALMEKSTDDMNRMMAAMDSITESSHKIETVIKVIDEIAFQTNILALNAAIEAARAGVHGKGFAVVADEVRELASKSAAAAHETSDLIQTSIQSVYEGNAIVRQTAENIAALGGNAAEATERMTIMAESSENQRLSIQDINQGIDHISQVIQANSIMAQENAMSSQKIAEQAAHLQQIVNRFKLRDQNKPPLRV